MSSVAKRKAAGLAISFLYAALYCLTAYSRAITPLFLLAHLGLLTLLSLSFLRTRLWGPPSNPDTLLRRLRRWVTDDYPASH